MNIAKTILSQLGGNRFCVFTGVKQLVDIGRGLGVKFARSNGINGMKVMLNGNDLYDIEFTYTHGVKHRVVKAYSDIYCDQLVELFEENTGLYTY